MEVHFSAEVESRLAEIAAKQGRDSESLVREAVERLLDYDAWFIREVDLGLAQVESGKTLSHEQAGVSQSPEWRSRELLLKAVEVLGDERKARAWLVGANASLEDRQPGDLAEASEQGYEEAYAVLGRMDYGLYP